MHGSSMDCTVLGMIRAAWCERYAEESRMFMCPCPSRPAASVICNRLRPLRSLGVTRVRLGIPILTTPVDTILLVGLPS